MSDPAPSQGAKERASLNIDHHLLLLTPYSLLLTYYLNIDLGTLINL